MEGAHARTVLVHGKVVLRDRRSTTIEEAEVLERAQRIQQRIVERLAVTRGEEN